MNDTKHETKQNASRTPGSWQAHSDHDPLLIIGNIDGPDDGRIHYTRICEVDDNAEAEANARLIIAAPKLLAALEGATDTIDTLLNGIHYQITHDTAIELSALQGAVDVAIAAAKGQPHIRYAIEMDIGGAFERLPEDGLYDSREEAEQEISDHVTNCIAAVEAGELDDSPDPNNFRVVEVVA